VTEKTLISHELAEFLQSGLSIVIATRDGDLQADGGTGLALRVHEGGARLTVFVYEEAARELLVNLKKHPEIALDCELPTSHRACQVKGNYLSSRRAKQAERAEVERQAEGFVNDLVNIGIPRAMTDGWKAWPCMALEIEVKQLFEQTPGPGAGDPLG
jgi:hypothetical protein